MIAKPLFEYFLPVYLPGLVRTFTRLHYNYLARRDGGGEVHFLNYGYHDDRYERSPLQLPPGYAGERYQAQLYDHVAGAVEWHDMDVLESGSGRGGGASLLARNRKPRSYTGLDLTPRSVDFCNHTYSVPGLGFRQGNAEHLPFPDASFDIVLNVESACEYPRPQRFFAEVARVLRPGGHFLYADLGYLDQMESKKSQLAQLPLELMHEEDITPGVARALELDQARKADLIDRLAPKPLRRHFGGFAGVGGVRLYRDHPEHGKRLYLSLVYRRSL